MLVKACAKSSSLLAYKNLSVTCETCCHRDEPTQTAALKIVQGMVQHQTLNEEQLCSLLPLVTKFGSHSSEACRVLMYDTLITAYGNIL
jgi:hypothetical protein